MRWELILVAGRHGSKADIIQKLSAGPLRASRLGIKSIAHFHKIAVGVVEVNGKNSSCSSGRLSRAVNDDDALLFDASDDRFKRSVGK
jgi:hypothetical protein